MKPMKDTEIKKPEVELRSLINCSCVMDVIFIMYVRDNMTIGIINIALIR
jgi:hypothetical protein